MAYTISALIAPEDILNASIVSNSPMRVVALSQNFGLIPITKAVQQPRDVKDMIGFDEEYPFHHLSDSVRKFALNVSFADRIAYVEAEFFGGIGYQSAVVWENGNAILGPFLAQNLPRREMPINRVLRKLGVQTAEEMDEFDTLRLGRYRHTDQWVTTTT